MSVTDDPVHGALEIITGYRVMQPGEFARLEVELRTGRTHQIRAHLAHIAIRSWGMTNMETAPSTAGWPAPPAALGNPARLSRRRCAVLSGWALF